MSAAMKIEAGKSYSNRRGDKRTIVWVYGGVAADTAGLGYWAETGRRDNVREHPDDLVAEWVDEPAGPVRTRTVTEIVPGVYGRVEVFAYRDETVGVRLILKNGEPAAPAYAALNASELRAVADVLVQLADAKEGGAA